MSNNHIQITIDGDSASGKGTVAKEIANKAKINYIAAGLIYRSAGFLIGTGKCNSVEEVKTLFQSKEINYIWDGQNANIIYKSKDISQFLESSMIAAMTPKIASESDNAIKIDNLIREIAIKFSIFCD